MANNIGAWSNDLFTLEKELRHGEPHNLVLVLRQEFGLSLQAAVDAAAKMHDDEVRAFVKLASNLPSFGLTTDAALKRYVAALGAAIRGHFDWAKVTARYRPLAQAA
jgi:hypothetical protein